MKEDVKNKILGFREKYGDIQIKCSGAGELPIDKIIEFQGDLKKLPEKNLLRLCKSIFINGFIAPFFVYDDGGDWKILDGHGRLKALCAIREAGIIIPAAFPYSEIEATSEADARQKLLAITSQFGQFQKEVLDEWISEIDPDIADVFALVDGEIDLAIASVDDGEETNGDDDIKGEPPAITKMGDLWEFGCDEEIKHRLLCGDATSREDVEKLVGSEKIGCVFADPPYGVDVVKGDTVGEAAPTKFGTDGSENIVEAKKYKKIIGDETTEIAENFYKNCIEMGFKNIVLWGGNYYTKFVPPSRCWIVWDKEMTGSFSEAEMAWTSFSKGGIKVFKFLWNGLSRKGNRTDELKSRVHPTQKPVGLFVDIFERFDGFASYFDGFIGSGTTIIACEKTGNKCFGVEMEPSYCDVTRERYKTWCIENGKNPIIKLNGEDWSGQ